MEGGMTLYFEEIEPLENDPADGTVVFTEGGPDEDEAEDEIASDLNAGKNSRDEEKQAADNLQTKCRKASKTDPKLTRSVAMGEQGVIQELNLEEAAKSCATSKLVLPINITAAGCSIKASARGGAAMAALGDNIYLFGGANRDGAHFNDLWRCSIEELGSLFETGAWQDVSQSASGEVPKARSGHSMSAVGKRIVVFGGMNPFQEEIFNDVHILEESQERGLVWTSVDTMGRAPSPRTEHSATVLDENRLLIFGGSSPMTGVFGDVHILDFSSTVPVWSTLRCFGSCPTSRELHGACLIGRCDEAVKLEHYGESEVGTSLAKYTRPQGSADDQANTPNNVALEHKATGNGLFVKGLFREASESYTLALKQDPRMHLVYGNRSACWLELGEAQKALHDAICAIRVQPTWGKGYFREAQACVALGRWRQAYAAFNAAVENAASDNEITSLDRHRKAFLEKYCVRLQGPSSNSSNNSQDNDLTRPHLCVYGGKNNESVLNDVAVLDLETLEWRSHAATSPFKRCGHVLAPLNGLGQTLFVFGGWDGATGVHGSALKFDVQSGMWTECSNSNGKEIPPRFSHAGCVLPSGHLATFGGVNFDMDLDETLLIELNGEGQLIVE